METTAVYWEPKIRTYGFQLDTDLSLLKIDIDLAKLNLYESLLEALGETGIKFSLVFGQIQDNNILSIFLALKGSSGIGLIDLINQDSNIGVFKCSIIAYPVDMISFQGPHYGDRYGIAYAAFSKLKSSGVSIIASCCSVSCIYAVLEKGTGASARDILLDSFEVPKKNGSRKTTLKNR